MDFISITLSIVLFIIAITGIMFSIHLITDGDVTGFLTIGAFSLVMGGIGYYNPVSERTEIIDKDTYHVFLSDKFVKLTTLSGDDMLISTDYWTITNINQHVVEKRQKSNIFKIDVEYPTYKLVEKR